MAYSDSLVFVLWNPRVLEPESLLISLGKGVLLDQ